MDTTGEITAKRFNKTHRGRRILAAQTKREQRNEWYFLGSCAFAWLAKNYGTASCSVDPVSDGNERTNETERGSCRTSETTSGSPQHRWADAGGTNEPNGSECDRYVSCWWD